MPTRTRIHEENDMANVLIGAYPELLDEKLLERVEKLGTALLCDGMKNLGVPFDGCMDEGINPVDISMKFVGTAATLSTEAGNNLPIHLALYSARPGYVLIIDGKGHTEHPYMGDLMISTAKAVGLKGVVVDGLVRDREGLAEMKFPVFARGFMQRGPAKFEAGEINYPIQCGGVPVNPGDLVMGDADGVVVVPRDIMFEVIENAEKKLAYEINRKKAIAEYESSRLAGRETNNLTPKWVEDMFKGAEA